MYLALSDVSICCYKPVRYSNPRNISLIIISFYFNTRYRNGGRDYCTQSFSSIVSSNKKGRHKIIERQLSIRYRSVFFQYSDRFNEQKLECDGVVKTLSYACMLKYICLHLTVLLNGSYLPSRPVDMLTAAHSLRQIQLCSSF